MAASRPGCFVPDLSRLRRIDPALFQPKNRDEMAVHWRQQVPGILLHGDTQPALVISTTPLVVASYSDELDGVVLLRVPDAARDLFDWSLGARLVSVNSYVERERFVADDVVAGPKARGVFGNVSPLLVPLASSQERLLARRLRQIGDDEWRDLDAALARRRERFGEGRARDGRPTGCALPVAA
jgi:hypothetical protein